MKEKPQPPDDIPNSILSMFGNAIVMAVNGRTDEMRARNAMKAAELEEKYPAIRSIYQSKMKQFKKLFKRSG